MKQIANFIFKSNWSLLFLGYKNAKSAEIKSYNQNLKKNLNWKESTLHEIMENVDETIQSSDTDVDTNSENVKTVSRKGMYIEFLKFSYSKIIVELNTKLNMEEKKCNTLSDKDSENVARSVIKNGKKIFWIL